MTAAHGGVERQGLGLGGEMCSFYIDGKRKFRPSDRRSTVGSDCGPVWSVSGPVCGPLPCAGDLGARQTL
jgi:hypothetical protein